MSQACRGFESGELATAGYRTLDVGVTELAYAFVPKQLMIEIEHVKDNHSFGLSWDWVSD